MFLGIFSKLNPNIKNFRYKSYNWKSPLASYFWNILHQVEQETLLVQYEPRKIYISCYFPSAIYSLGLRARRNVLLWDEEANRKSPRGRCSRNRRSWGKWFFYFMILILCMRGKEKIIEIEDYMYDQLRVISDEIIDNKATPTSCEYSTTR